MGISIKGLQEAQQANLEHQAAVKPNGKLGRAVQYGTLEAERYAARITHVKTGSLRAAHRVDYGGLKGRLYIDPGAVNPFTGERPAEYGLDEERRGGLHAFYTRTYHEAGKSIAQAAAEGFVRGLR